MLRKTERLIEAHLQFILKNQTPKHFLAWLHNKPIHTLSEFDDLLQCLQALDLTEHLHQALTHQTTHSTNIEDVVDVMTVDELAQYISSKTEYRQRLIQQIVYSPAFSNLVSQIINRALQDYLNNPLLKAGKAVLEQTLHKKLGQISESLLNQHLTDDKLYHLQADVWHKIKDIKLKQLVDHKDISKTLSITKSFWVYVSQSEFFKTLLKDWYMQAHVGTQFDLFTPALQHYFASDAFTKHMRQQLEQFYYLPSTQALL